MKTEFKSYRWLITTIWGWICFQALAGLAFASPIVTEFDYNSMGQLVTLKERDGSQEHFSYDGQGNLLAYANAQGALLNFEYTLNKQLSVTTDPLCRKENKQYDVNGNLARKLDPNGHEVLYSYDEANRPVRMVYPNGSTVQYSYTPAGQLEQVVDATGTSRFSYNSRGQLVAVVDGQALRVAYGYDVLGNRTEVIYPGNQAARYEYDRLNRLTHVTDWAGNQYAFVYDGADHLVSLRYPNGVVAFYDYDPAGRMTNFVYLKNEQPLLHHRIQRDVRGFKIKEEVRVGLSPAFQALEQTRSFDFANQLIGSGSDTFTHDRNGNLLNPTAADMLTFDFENRLLHLQSQNSEWQFGYNGLGDRVVRTVDGTVFYDSLDYGAALKNVLVEYDARKNESRKFLWGHGLLAITLADGSVRYAHADDMGNILALTDENGQISDEYAYDLYGQVVCRAAPGQAPTPNPYLFNGAYGVWHEGQGLYHMKARYYSAALKRFVSPDPAGLQGGYNFYEFAESNPQSFMDPFGLCAESGINRSFLSTVDSWLSNFGLASSPVEASEMASSKSAVSSLLNGVVNTAKGLLSWLGFESSSPSLYPRTDTVVADGNRFINSVKNDPSKATIVISSFDAEKVKQFNNLSAKDRNFLVSIRNQTTFSVDVPQSIRKLVGSSSPEKVIEFAKDMYEQVLWKTSSEAHGTVINTHDYQSAVGGELVGILPKLKETVSTLQSIGKEVAVVMIQGHSLETQQGQILGVILGDGLILPENYNLGSEMLQKVKEQYYPFRTALETVGSALPQNTVVVFNSCELGSYPSFTQALADQLNHDVLAPVNNTSRVPQSPYIVWRGSLTITKPFASTEKDLDTGTPFGVK